MKIKWSDVHGSVWVITLGRTAGDIAEKEKRKLGGGRTINSVVLRWK